MATEAVEFEVPESGAPNLGDEQPVDQQVQDLRFPSMPGWTQDEAAQVVGGMVANVTLILYAMKWKAPPPMEAAPMIAGNPTQEFPLTGMALCPILDFIAPKGSAAAVGVGLTAGVSEIVAAIARRSPVLEVPPKKEQQRVAPPATAPAPPAAPPEDAGFRYQREQLQVLQRAENAYEGIGIE